MRIYLNNIFRNIFLCIIILANISFPGSDEIRKNGDVLYFTNKIVIKLKDFPALVADGKATIPGHLQIFLEQFHINKIEAVFPSKTNLRSSSLGKILIVSYDNEIDPYSLSSKVKNFSEVEWAEPRFVYEPDFDPNDPFFSTQWSLSKILASQAWNITQGDTSVIIGIVDTGVDWDHPDLNANIWINRDEIPDNGVDDDLNGFIDDVRGWDFGGFTGTPDNNPVEDQPYHGTHVAGISSAVTNNGIGISSIGFKSKIMAVKTAQADQVGSNGPYIIYGFEGIVYAADNGAKVINCSWGGSGYSIFSQEVINYATSVGALVVAAAGNSGDNSSHYPSGYNNVLSVASTNSDDSKSGFSTYGQTVDVSAPGNGIYSTFQDNTYATLSGTSMASPLTAGLAALVYSVFPNYTPIQIGEQVRVNSDNVDVLNPMYVQLMGKGRINAFNAVTNLNSISVRAAEIDFSDEAPGGNGDGIFTAGETISIGVRFINYLNPTSSLVITLQSKNPYSTIVNGTFNPGSKDMLEEFDNFSSKYSFTLGTSLPANAKLDFILDFSDGGYSDYQWLGTIGNPSYATQAGNDIALTITGKGTLGFNDFPNNLQGDGFSFLAGPNLLFEGALILATSAAQISDVARGTPGGANQNSDFTVIQPFILKTPGVIADQQGSAIFNDNGAGSNKIGIATKLESFSFTDVPHNNYIILKYNFTNNTSAAVNNLYAGLFFDWDLIDGSGAGDVSSYDFSNNLSYTNNTTSGPDTWITTAAITSGNYAFYAINNNGGDGGFGVNDANGFTDAEKWQALSNGIGKANAGPGDISQVIGSGPFNINAGQTIDVGFVIGAGSNLEELQTIVANARSKYPLLILSSDEDVNASLQSFNLSQNFPNPFNPSTTIEYSVSEEGFVTLKIYNLVGEEMAALVKENKKAGTYKINFDASGFTSGVYFYKITTGKHTITRKMMLIK